MLETSSNQELLTAWRSGNEEAAQILVRRYLVRLTALARSRLSRKLARRLDPEDIVFSAWRSFFVAVGDGRLSVPKNDDLWPLLVMMTIRKLSRQASRHTAQRRDMREEVSLKDESLWQLVVSRDPSPDEAAMLVDEVESLMSQLDINDREILSRRLQGEQQAEIAAALSCSERTVRRSLRRSRELFLRSQGDNDNAEQTGLREVDHDATSETVNQESRSAPRSVPLQEQGPPPAIIEYRDLQLLKLVGQGGFGKVYKALRLSDGKAVAVKFLKKPFWKNERAVRSMLDEAQRIAILSHPNIIRHFGWGRSPHGAMFLVMELIDGGNVGTLNKKHPFSLQDVLECGIAIADALSVAHAAGIVHGDVTPSNVLRRSDGTFVLTDFGFARSLADPQRLHLGGTPGFLAPEQITDVFGPMSERTDLYGLGGLLYLLIAGRPPSVGDDVPEILANTLSSRRPVRISQFSTEVPTELDDLVLACLSKEPGGRPSTAAEIQVVLRRIATMIASRSVD